MANPLLDRVLPHELAERGQVIEFEGKVSDFERVAGIIQADLATLDEADCPRAWREATVATRLQFGWLDRERALPKVTGRIDTVVTTVCQRCLEAFELPVATAFELVFAAAADEESVADGGTEVWELETDTVRPVELVEEALVMALPLAPVHESQADCGPLAGNIPDGDPDTVRPFADLRSQMDNLNK